MENDPLIGQRLGTYHIQSKLGEGGMARVYRAYHTRLKREVAIKVILSQIADQQGFKARFEREAQLIASLQHPNIVAVYDFGDFGNLTYLVMQYVGGGTLRDQLRGGHALDPRQAILYCQQMARALHHAHLRGIVHRDVKPQNMLVSATDRNQLLLSDFGIAKLFDNRLEPMLPNLSGSPLGSDPSLTNADQIVGTAEYMSPEQVTGKPVDARTDIYALGVVLYQMLAGEVPFHSTTVQGLLFQHVYTPPRPLREINPYIPEILEQIAAKALAKAPQDRFQSAEEMAQALEAANIHITNRLSSSLPGNPTAPGQYTGAPSLSPSPTPPPGTPPSYYGQQPPPAHAGVAPTPQQPSAYGVTPPYGSPAPITHPGGAGLLRPALQSKIGRVPISYIAVALILLLGIGLVLVRQGTIPWFNSNQNTPSTIATPLTETFQNNNLNWPQGNSNGLTTNIDSNGYHLIINSSTGETHFPHPGVGTLPDNFTLTVQFEQTQGDSTNLFGLAFREKDDGNGGNVTGYAFVINFNGYSSVLKYDPGAPSKYSTLEGPINPVQGFQAGLGHLHTLQATVQGSKFFYKIDNQQVPGTASDHSIADSTYTGGQLTLYVSGTNATFVVKSVQLAIP